MRCEGAQCRVEARAKSRRMGSKPTEALPGKGWVCGAKSTECRGVVLWNSGVGSRGTTFELHLALTNCGGVDIRLGQYIVAVKRWSIDARNWLAFVLGHAIYAWRLYFLGCGAPERGDERECGEATHRALHRAGSVYVPLLPDAATPCQTLKTPICN